MASRHEPLIIQGGMGAAVSAWPLANAVARLGQMGVVSGTALDLVLCRRLQLGDPSGHLRRAMDMFPYPRMIDPILTRYFIPGGKPVDRPFIACPTPSINPPQRHLELLVVANFVEVYLAKEGHDGLVGVNFLEKIQTPTLPSLFGAMLAGVDYILMGAGIPRAIPGILDKLSDGEPVELPIEVDRSGGHVDAHYASRFDPIRFTNGEVPWLNRPKFLAIISSATLAQVLARKASGRVDGFVVEGPTAGGHNAPPRGPIQLNDHGEPIYGDRDVPDLRAIQALGLPFWLAGSYGSPDRLTEALERGAAGIQVGTAFAFCNESGLRADIRKRVLAMARTARLDVRTDPRASPTGFPFKVLQLSESISESGVYASRDRVCDLGYLRHAFERPDGSVGWRCPSEEIDAYVRKDGSEADTVGRKCVCNGLLANVGLAQIRDDGYVEPPLVTSGDEILSIVDFLPSRDADSYSASDVVTRLLSKLAVPAASVPA
ncbi:MAG: nitronate monooxygenase [Planctomycetes bacterium]|nr:nitronate monooxygenase [Planctomycetota bacterium]